MELQAFMWANGSASIAGRILFLWGGAMFPEHGSAMRRAYRRGRRARAVEEDRFLEELGLDVDAVRARIEPHAARS